MTARSTTKTAAKPTVIDQRAAQEAALKRYTASIDDLLASFGAVSWQRRLVAAIAGLATYAAGVYGALMIVDYLVVATMTLTGSAFLGFVVMVVAAVLAGYTCAVAGMRVYEACRDFDTSKLSAAATELRQASARRVSLVREWFKRSDDEVAAAVAR